jgi:subtilase family serine protease
VISLSDSMGEHFFTSAEVATIHSALEYATARHVTFVASSGDGGAISVLGRFGSTTPVKEVSLPASDPLALAAGGTSLNANPVTGAYISETAWNTLPTVADGHSDASGGGFSHVFARPAYQADVPGIGATRGVPDVTADASADTGMALAISEPGGNGSAQYGRRW